MSGDTPDHSRREFLRLTGSGALLLTVGTGTVLADESDLERAAKREVADRTGASIDELRIVNDGVATYDALNERYYDAKVENTTTGTLHQVTLDGATTAVDREQLRARSRRQYRAQYGKLSRDLYDSVQSAAADEEVAVDVWLTGFDRAADKQAVGVENRPDDVEARQRLKSAWKDRIQTRTGQLASRLRGLSGVTVEEAGVASPMVSARATPRAVRQIEQLDDVWMVFERSGESGDELYSASRTHNSYSERNGDYEASGIPVGIFEYSGYPSTSYVNRAGTYPDDDSSLEAKHETVVANCAAGTGFYEPGIASEADVYCAQDPNTKLGDKVDWLDQQGVAAINFSFYRNADGNREMNSGDFRWSQWMYNKFVTIVKSAGNESSTGDLRVTTPAKGFNTIAAGATDDKNDGDTSNDETASYSCWKNPRSEHDSPDYDIYPHDKPEVSAVGSRIDTPEHGSTAGTSFAAPHVTGLAGLLAKFGDDYGEFSFEYWPELVKPITMVSARNTGDSSYEFGKMGAGTIRADTAEEVVQNSWYISDLYDESNPTQTYTFDASSGENVRVALMWFSDVTAADFNDLSNARSDLDLDLRIEDPDGNYAAGSYSYDRGFEWATFEASQTGTYTIEVNKFDWQADDSSRFMGIAWHRA